MRKHVMWAIRDARGLPRGAKQVAQLVESRGVFSSSADTAALDLAVDRATFYRWRTEAFAHKVIREQGRGLVCDAKRVASYVPSEVLAKYWPCASEQQQSHSATAASHSATDPSHGATRRGTGSRNAKNEQRASSFDDAARRDRQLLVSRV